MTRKTVKELNIDFVELEEKMKAFEIVAKLLEKFDILDVVRKLEKIDIIEAKLDKLNEKNNLKEKEANNVEDVALVSTQSFNCRKCKKTFTTIKHLKQQQNIMQLGLNANFVMMPLKTTLVTNRI